MRSDTADTGADPHRYLLRVERNLVVLAGCVAFLLTVACPTPVEGERPAELSRAAPSAPRQRPWWRPSFPPAAIALAAPLPAVQIEQARVVPDLTCGFLDGAVAEEGGVFLYGWASDPDTGAPASAVIVLDSGRQVSPPVHVFRERADVAEATRNRRLATSGWALWLPPHRVTPGKHVFEAFALLATGKLGRLAGKASIDKPPARGRGPR